MMITTVRIETWRVCQIFSRKKHGDLDLAAVCACGHIFGRFFKIQKRESERKEKMPRKNAKCDKKNRKKGYCYLKYKKE